MTAKHDSGIFKTFTRAERKESSALRWDNALPSTRKLTFDCLGCLISKKTPKMVDTKISTLGILVSVIVAKNTCLRPGCNCVLGKF